MLCSTARAQQRYPEVVVAQFTKVWRDAVQAQGSGLISGMPEEWKPKIEWMHRAAEHFRDSTMKYAAAQAEYLILHGFNAVNVGGPMGGGKTGAAKALTNELNRLQGHSGAGKYTMCNPLLSSLERWEFKDADDCHPGANRAKQARGEPLTDADRVEWLRAVQQFLSFPRRVCTCPALKDLHRAIMSGVLPPEALLQPPSELWVSSGPGTPNLGLVTFHLRKKLEVALAEGQYLKDNGVIRSHNGEAHCAKFSFQQPRLIVPQYQMVEYPPPMPWQVIEIDTTEYLQPPHPDDQALYSYDTPRMVADMLECLGHEGRRRLVADRDSFGDLLAPPIPFRELLRMKREDDARAMGIPILEGWMN